MLNFFKRNEKTLVKSLFYGLIGGLFYSLLFVQRTKLLPKGQDNFQAYDESTLFEYIVEILRTSITISIVILAVTILYLYYIQYKKNM